MTPAYLREIDIIRELRLPYKVGRSLMARLKLDPTFPKPEPGTGGRRFWPLVEQWLRQHHGLGEAGVITEADGRENFNGWRQRRSGRKAGKAKRPSGTGASLSPTPRGVNLLWSPRSDLVGRGFPKTTRRLWPPSGMNPLPREPTHDDWEVISGWCEKYQAEMLLWSNGGAKTDQQPLFDGTIKSLSTLYQTDPDFPFKGLRYRSRQRYAQRLSVIEEVLGSIRVTSISFRNVKRWYEEFAAPDVAGGTRMLPRAYDLIAQLRLLFAFGKLALPKSSGCADVVEILSELRFAGGQRRRKEYLTYDQALIVCREAHRRGRHSVALAQAIMIECGVRQKDAIGEWVPRSEPGITDVFSGPRKWLFGARWDEIDASFCWRHRLSKSISKDGIMDPEAGTTEEYELLAFPMVRAELERMSPLDRANFPAMGPVVLNEKTGRPWCTSEFRRHWRICARGAGLPDSVQNRDSRPGAATEAELAGAPADTVRRLLGHARGETTEIYRRGNREIRSNIAKLRAEKRK